MTTRSTVSTEARWGEPDRATDPHNGRPFPFFTCWPVPSSSGKPEPFAEAHAVAISDVSGLAAFASGVSSPARACWSS
jgi:hypothetical protein